MEKRFQFFAVLLAALLVSACGAQTKQVDGERNLNDQMLLRSCQEALSSFAVIPTVEQNTKERRALIETIKATQEEAFGGKCADLPNWQSKFDQRYKAALAEAGSLQAMDIEIVNPETD